MAALRVVWWNVQRLLHPGGTALGRALDATDAHGWTRDAYARKVAILGAVLRTITGGDTPALLALSEVENARAALDVAAAAGFRLRVVRDPDAHLAGDDLVVLYDPRVLAVNGAPASYNVHNRFTTRDIFEVPFVTSAGDDLCVITSHWPSRRLSRSESLRIGAADYCRRLVDRRLTFGKDELVSVRGRAHLPSRTALQARAQAPILLLGDFNDEPYDASVQSVLDATRDRDVLHRPLGFPKTRGAAAVDAYLSMRHPLYNPSWRCLLPPDGPRGTTWWNGSWYMLDQVIVSRGLLAPHARVRFREDSPRIHASAHIELAGESVPVITRAGVPMPFDPRRGIGASDHLPLSCALDV